VRAGVEESGSQVLNFFDRGGGNLVEEAIAANRKGVMDVGIEMDSLLLAVSILYDGKICPLSGFRTSLLYETNLGLRNSLFVPRPRDVAYPGSGSAVFAQDLLRLAYLCSPNCFNSSRLGSELVPYIKMAEIGLHFQNEQFIPMFSETRHTGFK